MRFGIATTEIVPPFPTSMAGYGARTDPFDGVNDPLTFTAVVLEEDGRRALLGAADLCNFPNTAHTSRLLGRLAEAVGCPPANVLLNASHTHGGPKVPSDAAYNRRRYDMGAAERYWEWLSERILAAAAEAAGSLRVGTFWYGEGQTALPMNRRPDRDGAVPNAPNPGGPTDDRAQMLALRDDDGNLAAVGLRISCHPVTTGAQHLLTADFPGAWRSAFAQAFGPGVTPFFLQGAGADARPRHAANGDRWRQVRHAELPAIGSELLAETLRMLTGLSLRRMRALTLAGEVREVHAPCEARFTRREQFQDLLAAGGLQREYAEECLGRLDAGEPIPDHATYHVQTLWLHPSLALIGLDAEPLCALGSVVEQAVAPAQAMLLGYTNGCVSYVPDTAEMKRGGYEADSYLYSGWTGPLLPGLEHLFAQAVRREA